MRQRIMALLLLAVVLVLLCACGQNEQSEVEKAPYELFEWGTQQQTVATKFDDLNWNYDLNSKSNTVGYRDRNFEGVKDADTYIQFRFGKDDSLQEISAQIMLKTDQQIDTMAEVLKDKFGAPQTEENKILERTNGARFVNIEWQNETSKIEFSGFSALYFLTLSPL